VRVFRERTEIVLSALLLSSLVLVTPRIAESDAVEYFSYLPSVLFDRDLDFKDEYTVFYHEDPEGRAGFKETFLDRETATGLKLNFAPLGTALLWSPFYVAAHLVVGGDGLSQPYRTAVALGSAIYGALGLFSTITSMRFREVSRPCSSATSRRATSWEDGSDLRVPPRHRALPRLPWVVQRVRARPRGGG